MAKKQDLNIQYSQFIYKYKKNTNFSSTKLGAELFRVLTQEIYTGKRSLNLDNSIKIQEYSSFDVYHRIESLGDAYNAHIEHTIPLANNKKTNLFFNTLKPNGKSFSRSNSFFSNGID